MNACVPWLFELIASIGVNCACEGNVKELGSDTMLARLVLANCSGNDNIFIDKTIPII